ncbi:MAG: hypothetical protein ACOCV4_02270 [Myxococcota bacterium]
MAKKRQKKGGSPSQRRKRRSRQGGGASGGADASSGLMQGMVGGFRRVVGAAPGPKRSPWQNILTVLLIAAVVALLLYRFG